jgi:hypothetical protein
MVVDRLRSSIHRERMDVRVVVRFTPTIRAAMDDVLASGEFVSMNRYLVGLVVADLIARRARTGAAEP